MIKIEKNKQDCCLRTSISIDNKIESEIIIEEGIISKFKKLFMDKNYFLITNDTIAKLYPKFLSNFNPLNVIVIKDGEKYKNFKTYNQIIEILLKRKIERKDCIIALGGGVVGDLAGYVASTILRGVELVQIPTTLLAMCDSSIGGKTGYNTKFGKNLVGSFYLAKKVIIDPNFLATLPEFEYKCGLGEIVKYALIEKSCKCTTNYNLLNFLIKTQSNDIKNQLSYIINICASLKSRVVELDTHEGGLRKILNFAHTYAHPIETLSNYKNISHGEAVAYGIKYASKLAYNLQMIDSEYFERIEFLLNKFSLAQNDIAFKKEKIIELMKQDKKVSDGKINLLLPVAPSVVALFDDIDLPSIEASLP